MAKKKGSIPPPIGTPEPEVATLELTRRTLSVEVPFIEGLDGYCSRRVDVTLTSAQAEKLKGIAIGLEQREARLENGRIVKSQMHALQWMIESLG